MCATAPMSPASPSASPGGLARRGAFIGAAPGKRMLPADQIGSLRRPGRAAEGTGVEMPWFPDFVNAVELVRTRSRAAGRADPVGRYFTALNEGDSHVLETVWPGEVVVHDPRAGEIRGHRQLQRFVSENKSWLAEHHARIETVASTCVGGRAVVELVAHLAGDGRELAWPVAVVAESPNDLSVVFRTYCSQ